MWINETGADGEIYERAANEAGLASLKAQRTALAAQPERKHIVFAKAIDPLGMRLFRYVGTFKADLTDVSLDYLKFDLVRDTEKVGQARVQGEVAR